MDTDVTVRQGLKENQDMVFSLQPTQGRGVTQRPQEGKQHLKRRRCRPNKAELGFTPAARSLSTRRKKSKAPPPAILCWL